MVKKVFIPIVILVSIFFQIRGQISTDGPLEDQQEKWVDSVFNHLTDKQRFGQLFMVAAYSNLNEEHYKKLENLIREYNIGGLHFMQGGPGRQVNLINRYQKAATVPLLIGMDLEYGLGMRLDSTISYPKQMTLGAIQNEQYIYNLGAEIARQCKSIGVQINFAPIVDINKSPDNSVIGTRSFGEDKSNVAKKGKAYVKGLQNNGIIAGARHFPGLGDTNKDSRYSLPVINHSDQTIRDTALYPFREMINNDLLSIMVTHMRMPSIDPELPSTLSKKIVTDLLKNELSFDGLVITDALNMKALTRHFDSKKINIGALISGNDMLLFPENIPEAIDDIIKAVEENQIDKDDLYQSVRKILKAKYWSQLHQRQPLEHRYILDKLNTPTAHLLNQKLYEQAITVVKNDQNIVPMRTLETETFASLNIGASLNNEFQEMLEKYSNFKHFYISSQEKSVEAYDQLFEKLRNYSTVIIGINDIHNSSRKRFGTHEAYVSFLEKLQKETKVVTVIFGNPYSLKYFDNLKNLICAYEENKYTWKAAPQIIFGALSAKGKLPVSVTEKIALQSGVNTKSLGRLAYSLPEDVGLDSEVLKRIDIIANEVIKDEAAPGCQVLVAKNGAVVFEKSYGFHTYEQDKPVTNKTVYDLASLTKVLATLQAIMFLEDQGLLDINKKVSYYLPDLKKTNKANMTIKNVLTHQAGLLTFIPFWVKTMNEQGLDPSMYKHARGHPYETEVTSEIYGLHTLKDSLWHWIKESNLRSKKKPKDKYTYKYSDLGFFIMHRIAEKLLNQPINEFLDENFYTPLGMNFLSYLPLQKYPKDYIAPTEFDNYFRNSLIQGTVHDPGAAMMGGVAGHAGIFGNANDIAKILQMHLQDGIYGGIQYYRPGTLSKFTRKQFKNNRRGLGWDKPTLIEDSGPTSIYTSPKTFGHTGFTGTAAWVDPAHDLIYIFLSNRIYPSADNFKLIENNIRTRIQDIIYQAMR